jgi:hypothetical protein
MAWHPSLRSWLSVLTCHRFSSHPWCRLQ